MLHLQEAFNTIADTFVFFDKDNDGYVTKKEMVQTLNEASPVQETAGDIAVKRFRVFSCYYDFLIAVAYVCTIL